MERWEVLAEKVYGLLKSDKRPLVFVFAPTGYGKTMSSPYLLKYAGDGGFANRLIHVVPVRALLREIYMEKFSGHSKLFRVGYQSMDRLPGEGKSPYFLAELIVTTLDSFLWNIYKIPVAEISKILREVSEGHYYPVLASIATSIVVFDEAHVYIGEHGVERREPAVASAIRALLELNVPTVIATATMSSGFVREILRALDLSPNDVGVVYICHPRCNGHARALEGLGLKIEYMGYALDTLKWETSVVDAGKIERVVEERCRSEVVLLVANKVDRVVELYRRLREKCGDAALIHSRLIEVEREEAYRRVGKIREAGRGLIVASPIIEVGVDIDADTLVTEAAPLENMIQRAGRLCRPLKRCEKAEVVIVKEVDVEPVYGGDIVREAVGVVEEELNKGRCIEWRLFSSGSCVSAIDVLEKLEKGSMGRAPVVEARDILTGYLVSDSRPSDFISDVSIEGLFRGLSMIKVAVERCGRGVGSERLGMCSFATSFPILAWLERSRRCLVTCGDGNSVKMLVITAKTVGRGEEMGVSYSVKEMCSQALYEIIYKKKGVSSGIFKRIHSDIKRGLGEGETAVDFFVVLKEECYKAGEGAYV